MILTHIQNDMIYYSQVNEDNRVERKLLQEGSWNTVVAVAGSGERILALLDNIHSTQFHVVDVNEEALFLVQLKLAALRSLTVEQYWQFCGHHPAKKQQRVEWFRLSKDKLSPSCKIYWEKNIAVIEKGILDAGHFEKFLQRVRPFVNLVLRKKFMAILSGDSVNAKEFPKGRWKVTSRIFSHRWIYKVWGNRDIAFVGQDTAVRHIPEALNTIIYKGEAPSSFIMHLVFKGHLRDMKEADLPPSLQKEVLTTIRRRLVEGTVKVHYHHTDMLSFVTNTKRSIVEPVFYSLSDILSFESVNYLQDLIAEANVPDNRIVWRTFLRNRLEMVKKTNSRDVQDHTEAESTRMYQVFSIKKNL